MRNRDCPLTGFSLWLILPFKLCAGPVGSSVPLYFTSECSLESGPLLASISMCSRLYAFLSAGLGWISAPLESASECPPESESSLDGLEIYTSLYESVTF